MTHIQLAGCSRFGWFRPKTIDLDGFRRSFSHVFPSNRPFQWAAGDGADGSVEQASVLDPLHVPWIPDECWTMLDLWMGFFDIFWGCFLMAFWMAFIYLAMDAMVGTAIFERWNCHWNCHWSCQVAWLHGKLLVADRCALRQVQRRSGRVFNFRLFFKHQIGANMSQHILMFKHVQTIIYDLGEISPSVWWSFFRCFSYSHVP